MKIGWMCGYHQWAYESNAENLIAQMPKYEHKKNNRNADVIVYFCDQFGSKEQTDNKKVVFFLSGRRIINADG